MIGDAIDTFRLTTPAVNKEFVQKSQKIFTESHTRKIDMSIVSFQVTSILVPNV